MNRPLLVLSALVLAILTDSPAKSAIWAPLRWTNPPEAADSIRCIWVRAPGDSMPVLLYGTTSPMAVKHPGSPGARDSAYLSVSVANVVGPASIRLVIALHNGAGWSDPSNPVSLFYGARDTLYLGPWGSTLPTTCWWCGPGLFGFSQQLGDSSWVAWRHQEVAQNENRARLCLLFGYACRRGARDTAWCALP